MAPILGLLIFTIQKCDLVVHTYLATFQNESFLIVSKNGNFLYIWNYLYNAV